MLGCVENILIEALTATVAKNRIAVADRCKELVPEKKIARLIHGTGIERLSIAAKELCTSDLCVESAERLFATGLDKKDIGAIIYISQTSDYPSPATSYYLQNRLGLSKDVLAFDINLGCSGFVYGVYIAAVLLTNIKKKILVCCGDTSSRNAFPKDTSMLSIAADAGSAAIISRGLEQKKVFYNIESFGERADYLLVARGAARADKLVDAKGIAPVKENYCVMNGMGVMDFTLQEVPENINSLMTYAKVSADKMDLAVVHQANKMIVNTLADKVNLPRDRMPFKCSNIGNTSSASIPVCLSEMKKDGEYSKFEKVLLSGFGVGMSVASIITDFSQTKILETGEL